ncbi:MAG TPA: glucosaminidase domain-containing protein [Chloroflexia bacterium]|nr:glucosaminidase domain-containing protein [Chloroflexia bacterium]
MSAGLARTWDFYDDEEDELESELSEEELELEQYEEEDEDEEPEYEAGSPFVEEPVRPRYRSGNQYSAPVSPYTQSFTINRARPVAPSTYYLPKGGITPPAEAVYSFSFSESLSHAQSPAVNPALESLGSLLARGFRSGLLRLIVGLIVGWLVITSAKNWLDSRNSDQEAAAEIYRFGASGAVVDTAIDQGNASVNTRGNLPPVAPGAHGIEGKPSITVAKIEQVLKQYNSPAAGKGQALYDLGVKYNIDPAFALAFFVHESTAGTKGVAVTTKSIGNIRQTANSGFDGYQGFRKYPTWEAGMEDWYKLIRNLYINGWNLRTVEQIVPKYAPSEDHNNPTVYINNVNSLVASWRSSQ